MIKKITVNIFCLFLLSSISFAQSAYYFKTTEALELEKWDAKEASNSVISSAIAKELASRTKADERIEQLEADLNEKLKIEDYFGAETIKTELDRLKANQVKAKEFRESIESSLAIEDYEKAAQFKTALLDLDKPVVEKTLETASTNKTETITNGGTKNSTTGLVATGDMLGALTTTNNMGGTKPSYTSNSSTNTDRWGRTRDQNLRLYKKKMIRAAITTGIGVAMAIPGAWMFRRYVNSSDSGGEALIYTVSGAILVVSGGTMVIVGAIKMMAAPRFKKRANQLANGTVSLSPSIMNIHSYSGASVNSSEGYGISLNYTF